MGRWDERLRNEKRSNLKRTLSEEKRRLNFEPARHWNETHGLDAIGEMLGIPRRLHEPNNEYFSRMEGTPAFEKLREQVKEELKGTVPSLAKRLEAEDADKKASFMEELQKL